MATVKLTQDGTSKFVQAGDIRMHYNEAGDGPPLIMIHGGGPGATGWSNFVTNIGPLSEHFHVMLVDMPGFGGSDPVVLNEPRIQYNARAFKAFMDALGLKKAHFIGNSQGGGTSAKFAIDYPEYVDKLVLMGAAGGGMSIFSPAPMEGIKHINQLFLNPTKEGFRELIKVFVYDSSFVTEELLEQRLQGTLAHPEHLEARKMGHESQLDLTPDMGKIKSKTLLIWGRDDRFVPLDHGLKYLFGIPDARLLIVPRCGHWVQYEHSEEFNRVVTDFILNG
jgi:pimeloyl-ACP methyl ester carboxylesterase